MPIAKNELAFIMTANWMPILLYHAWMLIMSELTNEEHEQWCEMAKITLKVVVPPDTILNTVSAKDQVIFILI